LPFNQRLQWSLDPRTTVAGAARASSTTEARR
jgi:hypothetical protein